MALRKNRTKRKSIFSRRVLNKDMKPLHKAMDKAMDKAMKQIHKSMKKSMRRGGKKFQMTGG